ncbi:MAG: hypothetical protein ACKOCW_10625, partial [Planctomycetaceae bacterium]
MPKKRDIPRRQVDRRSPWNNGNLLWSLIAVGVAGLFALSLLGTVPELELPYSDLVRLIRASGDGKAAVAAPADADALAAEGGSDAGVPADPPVGGWIEVREGLGEARRTVRYGDLADVMIGDYAVTGTVRELDGPTGAAAARRRFRTAIRQSESSAGSLAKLLAAAGITHGYEPAPSPWRNWLPLLVMTSLFGLLLFTMMRRIG